MGGCDDTRGRNRPLPKHSEIDAKRLADPAQCVFE